MSVPRSILAQSREYEAKAKLSGCTRSMSISSNFGAELNFCPEGAVTCGIWR